MGMTFTIASMRKRGEVQYTIPLPSARAGGAVWQAHFVTRGYYDLSFTDAEIAAAALEAQGVMVDWAPPGEWTAQECQAAARALRGHPERALAHLAAFLASACEHGGVVIE